MNKQNDWFAANLNQPNFGLDEMFASGITPDNTTLRDKDYYKNIKQVQNKFTDSSGKFNEDAYNDYYDSLKRSYNQFSTTNFESKMLNDIESSPYDIFALDNPNTFDSTVKMFRNTDPQRHQIGMSGLNVVGEPSWDEREVAQENFVRDENGNKLNWTPNKKWLGYIFGPTLVKAAWDEDGYHEENGRQVFHKKGQAKYDENGDPYYEILGKRSIYGKDVLHVSDIVTKDDAWINKLDFVDSDSLDKSAMKTIFKTAATVGMWAIPYVGPWLGGVKAFMDLTSVLPIVGKSIDSFIAGNTDNDFGKAMNAWEGFMSKFDKSQTQYAKEHQWAFENIGDMLASSAGQLYSQRLIGQIPLLFKNHAKDLSKLTKLGQQMSLGYMALTSAEDSYRDFKDAGANDVTAGLGFLATAASMYGLLFRDSALGIDPEMRYAWREFSKEKVKSISDEMKKSGFSMGAKTMSKEGKEFWLKRWWKAAKEFAEKYPITGKAYPKTLTYANRALNEGIEETIEEGFTDIVKGLALAAEELGLNVTDDGVDKLDFGFSVEEMANRYLTSFVGGALGGAVFEGLTQWENYWKNGYGKVDNFFDKSARNKILWYISNGQGAQLKKALEYEHKKGHLGDTNLTFDFEETTDAAGNKVFASKAVGPNGENQNDQMFKRLSDALTVLEDQATRLGILDSDEEIMNRFLENDSLSKAVLKRMQEEAAKEGISLDEFKKKHLTSLSMQIMAEDGVLDTLFSDIYSLKNRILAIDSAIKNREEEISKKYGDGATAAMERELESDPALKRWKDELKAAQDDYKALMTGQRASEYIGLACFAHNDGLQKLYLSDKEDDFLADNEVSVYALQRYGVNFESLSDAEKDFITTEHGEFLRKKANDRIGVLREAYNIHKNMINIVNSTLSEKKSELTGKKMNTGLEDLTFAQYTAKSIQRIQMMIQRLEEELSEIVDPKRKAEIESKIKDLEARIVGLTAQISELTPEMLERAVTNSEELFSNNFEEELPLVLADEVSTDKDSPYYIGPDQLLTAAKTLNNYFQFLKNNNIILAEDDPVLTNTLRVIWRTYVNTATDLYKAYVTRANQAIMDSDKKQVLKSIIENTGEDFNLAILDDSDVNKAADRVLRARRLKRLRDSNILNPDVFAILKENGDVTDADLKFAISYADRTDEEINAILDENGEDILKLKNALAELDIEDINESTRNLFTEHGDTYYFKEAGSLEEKVNAVATAILKGSDALEEELNKLKQFIESEINDGYYKKQLLETLVKPLEGVSEQIKSAKIAKAELTPSPISDLLEWISIQTEGHSQSLIDFLRDEYKTIVNQEALNNYQHRDLEKQIKAIKTLFPVIRAILASSRPGSFNSEINLFREKDEIEKLTVLDDDQYEIFVRELTYIENRLEQLSALNEANVQSNSDKQIEDQIVMRPKFLRRFIGDVHVPGIPKKLAEIGIDTNAIWEKVKGDVDEANVTRENYKDYFQAVLRWEQEVYNQFWEKFKDKSKSEIGEILGNCFEIVNDGGAYNGEDDTKVTDMSAALYFLQVIGYKNFQSLYKSQLNRDGDYPFDAQEFAVRSAFSAILNPEIFNGLVKKIKSNPGDDGTISNTMSLLTNVLTILGENGTGKSKICTAWVLKLLKATGKSVGVVATTMFGTATEGRLSELSTELDIDPANVKPTAEIIAKINDGKQFGPDDYIKVSKEHLRIGTLSEERLGKIDGAKLLEYYGNEEIKVLMLDEGTFASQAELQAIAKAATDAGIFVIINGDLNQQYKVIQYNKYDGTGKVVGTEEDTSGLEDCRYMATPKLTTSMRAAYIGKQANGYLFNSYINEGVANLKRDPMLATEDIIPSIKEVNISLQYTEDENGLYGDRIITSDDVKTYITKFDKLDSSSKKPRVVIITDDEDKYSALASDNIAIYKPNEVQGREFDYAVVDVDLSKPMYKPFFSRIKAINTWLSRARKGAVMVEKPEIKESNFKITSEVNDRARGVIDSIRERPEEIEAYKDFVDGLYESVEAATIATPTTPTTPPPPTGPTKPLAAGIEVNVAEGFSTDPDKTADEVVTEVIDEVLTGSENNNGYEDEDHYREHHKILTDSNVRASMTYNGYSLEGFWRWLFSDESNDLLFTKSDWNPIREDLSNEKKDNYKLLVRNIIYTIVSSDNPAEAFKNQEITLQTLASQLFDGITDVQFVKLLEDSLNKNGDNFSAFKVVNDKADSSFIWFVFGSKSGKTIALPMGRTTKLLKSGIYKNIDFVQKIPYSQITSKGRVHRPLEIFDKKVHCNKYAGIFIAPKLNSVDYSQDLSDPAKAFALSIGRTFNAYDLNFIDESAELRLATELFSPQLETGTGKILDFTKIGSGEKSGATTRLAGTQAIIELKDYLELARSIQIIAFGQNDTSITSEQRDAAKNIVKTKLNLDDKEILTLSVPSTSTDAKQKAAAAEAKYQLLRDKCELLNDSSRAKFASAIFRICSEWFGLDATDPKFKFASKVLSNLLQNYMTKVRGDGEYEGYSYPGSNGKYLNGLNLTLTGTNGAGYTVYQKFFIYPDDKGNLHYEISENRPASKEPSIIGEIGNIKEFIDDKGINLEKLVNTILSDIKSKSTTATAFSEIFDVVDDLDAITNLFKTGKIAILPGKKYNKNPNKLSTNPDEQVEQIKYYDCFDSDIAELIPENEDNIYSELDVALRKDPIFRYGLYLSDHSSLYPNKIGKNTFTLLNLKDTPRIYTTDLADMMLPMFETTSYEQETDDDVKSKVNKFGNLGLTIDGATSNDGIIVSEKNGTYTFGTSKLIVSALQLKSIIDSKDYDELEKADVISESQPMLVKEITKNGNELNIKYVIGAQTMTASIKTKIGVNINKWLNDLGVAAINSNGLREFGKYNNEGWFGLDSDNKLKLCYRNKPNADNDRKQIDAEIIGYSSKDGVNTYYISNKPQNRIVAVSINNDDIDPDLKSAISSQVRSLQDYGTLLKGDDFGFYFLKNGEITYLERNYDSKPIVISVKEISGDTILLSNNQILQKDDDPILFNAIKAASKVSVNIVNAELTLINGTYYVTSGKISIDGDYLRNKYDILYGENYDDSDVTVVSISEDGKRLTVKRKSDNAQYIFESKNGENFVEVNKKNITKRGINNKIDVKILKNERFSEAQNEISEEIARDPIFTTGNESQIISALNEILKKYAVQLGKLYQIQSNWSIKEINDAATLLNIAIGRFDFGEGTEINNIEISRNSAKISVTLQDGTKQNYIANIKNKKVEISLLDSMSEIAVIKGRLDEILNGISNESVRNALSNFLNHIAANQEYHKDNEAIVDDLINLQLDPDPIIEKYNLTEEDINKIEDFFNVQNDLQEKLAC